jgi:hypothetical protein
MELIRNEKDIPLCEHLFKLSLPPYMHPILLDYVERAGLCDLFRHCIKVQPRSFTTEVACPFRWNVRRHPFTGVNSDMYWISPANLETHNNLLSFLAVCGFSSVFSALAAKSDRDASQFKLFQATFLLVSRYTEMQFHVDFDDGVVGKVWSVIIPIVLVNGSNSELIIRSKDTSQTLVEVKYLIGEAVIFAPDVVHSTAVVEYADGYRVCLSLNVGFIHVGNVHHILSDITQQFPPKSSEYLLSWPPHWTTASPSRVINIPEISEAALLGVQWLSSYSLLINTWKDNVEKATCNFSPKLLQWMAYQRYCYALKYREKVSLQESFSDFQSRASQSLTHFREVKLREIGFNFVVDRDAGCKQSHWLVNFSELKSFFDTFGHCQVRKRHDRKLYFWLKNQHRVLSESSMLSTTKAKRRYMLCSIGAIS